MLSEKHPSVPQPGLNDTLSPLEEGDASGQVLYTVAVNSNCQLNIEQEHDTAFLLDDETSFLSNENEAEANSFSTTNPSIADESNLSTTPQSSSSVHVNRNWCEELRSSFKEQVIGRCSRKVIDAVAFNINISSPEERRAVFKEILNETLSALHLVFGNENPKLQNAKKVRDILVNVYPALFKYEDSIGSSKVPDHAGYGLGGNRGLKNLPTTICQRYHDQYLRPKKGDGDISLQSSMIGEQRPAKRMKNVYGVNNKKWHAKASQESIEALSACRKIIQFKEREEVFNKNRDALQQTIRVSAATISKTCVGFFEDPRHLEEHFKYLTDGACISLTIERGLKGHMENLETYLLYVNANDGEFIEKYGKMVEDCNVHFGGSVIHKYIHLLRWASLDFDKMETSLMRVEDDGPSSTASPYILAVKVGNHYSFELWVEGARLLLNMDINGALAAYLHLCFVFNLKYSKVRFIINFIEDLY